MVTYELQVAGVAGGATARNPTFQNNPYLNNTQLLSLEIYSPTDVPNAPSGNALFSTAVMSTGFLCLYSSDPQTPVGIQSPQGLWLNQIPLWDLHRINNGTDPFVYDLYEFFPRSIVWEQSYVQLTANPANTVDSSFLFNVGYQLANGN